MEKIYRRRRITVSFIAVLIVVLAVWGVVALGKGIKHKLFPSNEDNKTVQTDVNKDKDKPSQGDDKKKDDDSSKDGKDHEKLVINPEDSKEKKERKKSDEKSSEKDEKDKTDEEASSDKKADDLKVKPLSELKKDLGEWNLILANPDTPLPKDFVSYTKEIVPGREIDNRIIEPAKKMLDAAKADGIDLLICSAYRSIARQQDLFDNSINGYKAQGYSQEDAVKFTKHYYSIPGQSEHHTGLAMDIVTPSHQVLDAAYEETDAAKWLYNNAYKYGFILRYPKDKEAITKISYEPWHYRYVGVDHAAYIFEHKICFEEYLDKLKNA